MASTTATDHVTVSGVSNGELEMTTEVQLDSNTVTEFLKVTAGPNRVLVVGKMTDGTVIGQVIGLAAMREFCTETIRMVDQISAINSIIESLS